MTTEESTIDVAGRQRALAEKGITGGIVLTPVERGQESIPAGRDGAAAPWRKRATRKDAGKPRESVYVSIPGVRFDLTMTDGKEAFFDWVSTQIKPESLLALAVGELTGIIDRLRAK